MSVEMGSNAQVGSLSSASGSEGELNVSRINSVFELIRDTKAKLVLLQSLCGRFVSSNSQRNENQLKAQLLELTNIIREQLGSGVRQLDKIRENLQARQKIENDPEMSNSVSRFIFYSANALQSKLFETSREFFGVQAAVKAAHREKMFKKLEEEMPFMDPDILRRIRENPEDLNQIIGQLPPGNAKVQAALSEIEGKVARLEVLEMKVVGLVDLVKELRAIIANQTMAVNSIRESMIKIHDHLEPALKNVEEGVETSMSIQEVCLLENVLHSLHHDHLLRLWNELAA